jgi:hypothetical protein
MTIPATTAETVKDAVSTASVLNHIRTNKVEYLLGLVLLHLIGVSDRILAQLSGVCF